MGGIYCFFTFRIKPFFHNYLSFLSHQFNSSHPLAYLIHRSSTTICRSHTQYVSSTFGNDETIRPQEGLTTSPVKKSAPWEITITCVPPQINLSLAGRVSIVTLHILFIILPAPALLSTDYLQAGSPFFFPLVKFRHTKSHPFLIIPTIGQSHQVGL